MFFYRHVDVYRHGIDTDDLQDMPPQIGDDGNTVRRAQRFLPVYRTGEHAVLAFQCKSVLVPLLGVASYTVLG